MSAAGSRFDDCSGANGRASFTPSTGSPAATRSSHNPGRAQIVSSIRNSHLPAGRVRQSALPPLIRRAASVLVNSERGRQLVIRTCKVSPARIALVPNGIDVDLLRTAALPGALRRELEIPPLSPVVLYVGRNARVKNIPRLLDVVRQLLRTNPEAHMVLAGEGLDRRLVDGTDLASASRLHCLGPRADIPSLLRDATLLLLTSDSEGMPNVVLEALAVGVPVVATAVGDIAQILPEQCGVLVPCETEPLVAAVRRVIADAPSFARAVEQVLDASASDSFRRGDGQRDRRGVAKRRHYTVAVRLRTADASPHPQRPVDESVQRHLSAASLSSGDPTARDRLDDFPSGEFGGHRLRRPAHCWRALEGSAEGRDHGVGAGDRPALSRRRRDPRSGSTPPTVREPRPSRCCRTSTFTRKTSC